MNIYGHSKKRRQKGLKKFSRTATLSVDSSGWVTCPHCLRNRRLMRVLPETRAQSLEVFCRDCKTRIVLNIGEGQRVELRSQ